MIKSQFISRIKNRLVKTPSSLSLTDAKAFLKILNQLAFRLLSLASGKVLIGARLQRFNKFLVLLLKAYRHHGSMYVVKWLSASHTAVQRKLSSKPMKSLRELVPELPLPRLINGLPSFIGTMDRQAIRQGCPSTIRFWLTILSLYRVINTLNKLKLQTISDPYGGSEEAILELSREIKDVITFNKITRKISALSAKMIHKTTKAGPNYANSCTSMFTDAFTWKQFPELRQVFSDYSKMTNSSIDSLLTLWGDVADRLYDVAGYEVFNISAPQSGFSKLMLGKLAFKLEAAGKVRVFAIVDSWTQSLLKPLHEDLFAFLKRLPNDGTFNQDRSFERSMEKAKKYNMAFAFDLSSATDRLPIKLQIRILDLMYKDGLGELWAKLLIGREYIIRSKQFEDIRGDFMTYGTGQPMGCLSSWAMLATTHHLIMQAAAFRVYGTRLWYDKYEVLGDDIVIFDNHVAASYLEIMKSLDVGINLSKSLISEQLQTIEFAKRTAFKGIDVSGLSWKQLMSENTLPGRVNLALSLLRKGYIGNRTMLARAIVGNRYFNFLSIFQPGKVKDEMEFGITSILGSFIESDKISLGSVVSLLIDPLYKGGTKGFKPSVPMNKSLQSVLELAKEGKLSSPPTPKKKPKRDFIADMFAINPVKSIVAERVVDRVQIAVLAKANRVLTKFEKEYELLLNKAVLAFFPDKRFDPLLGKLVPHNFWNEFSKTQKLIIVALVEKALLRDAESPEVLRQVLVDYQRRLDGGMALPSDARSLLSRIEFLATSFDVDKESPIYGSEASIPAVLKELKDSLKHHSPKAKPFSKLELMMQDLEDNNFMDFQLMARMRSRR